MYWFCLFFIVSFTKPKKDDEKKQKLAASMNGDLDEPVNSLNSEETKTDLNPNIPKEMNPFQVLQVVADAEQTANSCHVISDNQKWRCDACTLLNPMQVDQCIACRAWKPRNAVIIMDTSRGDTVKKAKRDDKPISTSTCDNSTSGDFWRCKKCTLENPISVNKCNICEAPRIIRTCTKEENSPIKRKVAVTQQDKQNMKKMEPLARGPRENMNDDEDVWQCPHCSYSRNPITAESCDCCQGDRQHPGLHNMCDSHVNNTNSGLIQKTCQNCLTKNQNTATSCISCRHMNNIWSCKRCTLENPITAPICGACQSPKEIRMPVFDDLPSSSSAAQRNGKNPVPLSTKCSPNEAEHSTRRSPPKRQSSQPMTDLRQRQEEEELEKWKQIVEFCQLVCLDILLNVFTTALV